MRWQTRGVPGLECQWPAGRWFDCHPHASSRNDVRHNARISIGVRVSHHARRGDTGPASRIRERWRRQRARERHRLQQSGAFQPSLVTFVMRAQARADAAACQRQPGGYGHAGMAMAGHIHGARLRQTHRAPTTATRRDARSEGNDPAGMSPVWRTRYAQHHAGAVCVGWRRPRASCSALGIPRSQMGRTGPDAPSRAGLSCTFGHEADEA